MSAWLVAWLVIGLVATTALVACAIFLVFHVILLGRTARRAQEELGEVAAEAAEQARRAGDRAAHLQVPTGHRRARR
jgi:hypothetical protein